MKTPLPLIYGIVLIALDASPQGTVQFSNYALDVDAPVTNAAGVRIVGPGPYVADLFWSSDTNAPTDSLTAAGFDQSFLTYVLNGGGYFIGGSKRMPVGGWILAQVRVWDLTRGSTYKLARDAGGEYGSSNPVIILLAIPPAPATSLLGLQGFQLETIPEPSTTALTIIGCAALWLCHRRARKSARARQRT